MKEKLVFALVACVLAVVAGAVAKFAPEAVGPVAIPLVGVVVVVAAYLKPPAGGPPSAGGGGAALMLLASLALSSTACDALKPKSVLDVAKASCIAANAFLDVSQLRAVCAGLESVTDDDLKTILSSHRAGASKLGAAKCGGDAGAK